MTRVISLLGTVAAIVILTQSGFAQSTTYTSTTYSWLLDCSKLPTNTGASSSVNWYWLHDGVQIQNAGSPPDGFASCATGPLSGSGVVPAMIDVNGMPLEVNGIGVQVFVSEFPAASCMANAMVTKSFSPLKPHFAINETVSLPHTVRNLFGGATNCPHASFSFNIQT
jgi:hypothetical protein